MVIPRSLIDVANSSLNPSISISIVVQRVLFDFGLEKLFNESLAFPPLHREFYILLIANSKDHWIEGISFVLLKN